MYQTLKSVALLIVIVLMAGCSSGFYVKVADQYGEPVPDVLVRVGSPDNFFIVAGSRVDHYKTDKNGRFKLRSPLMVNMQFIGKNGYEFQGGEGLGSKNIYKNYNDDCYVEPPNSYSNPYYILAWKRGLPEPLIRNKGGVGLIPNDGYYEIEFTKGWGIRHKKLMSTGSIDSEKAILLVSYQESEEIILNQQKKEMHPWELTLAVPEGGLIEATDLIQNLAPESGYQQQWIIRSADLPYIDSGFKRKFYLKAKNGQVYGQFRLEFRPVFRTISFDPIWLNLNGSRNLTRPKKYVYCLPRAFVPEDCSLDDYGP